MYGHVVQVLITAGANIVLYNEGAIVTICMLITMPQEKISDNK